MSTPNPVPAAPSFWHALGTALKHDDLPLAVAPLRTFLAAVKAAKTNPVTAPANIAGALAALQLGFVQAAPQLAIQTESDVADAVDGLLAKVTPTT